jgi:PAS domain S-box-containing protein
MTFGLRVPFYYLLSMNTKWKVILSIMLLITAICAIFGMFFQRQFDDKTTKFIAGKKESAFLLAETLLLNTSHSYRKRIISFINPNLSPIREQMLHAFADRDRKKLQELSQPLLRGLKRENPYFSTIGWILPDNHVFLRIHNPKKFGDDVGEIRPDIAEVNKEKQQKFGFDIGTSSLQYRIVQPVFYNNKYIGAVQFGIEADIVLDALRDKLKTISGMAIKNEEFDLVKEDNPDRLKGRTHTIVADDIAVFSSVQDQLDWNLDQQMLQLMGKPYVLLKILPLLNFRDDQIGFFFMALDLSGVLAQKRDLFFSVFILSSFLLIISFCILYFSYGSLVQRIINLNDCLEKNNADLEKRVHERTVRLQESEQRLQRILDRAPVGILIADIESRKLHYANPAVCKMLGYEKKSLELLAVNDLHSPDTWLKISKEFQSRDVGTHRTAANISFVRKDGSTFEANVIHTNLKLGKHLYRVGFIVDQTEIHEMEIQLHRAQKMEAIGLMAGGVAHDLNNILSGIVSYPELLLLQLPEESAMREPLSAIRESGQRAAAVVNDLLTVARGAATVRKPHDLNLLIREYLDSPEYENLKTLNPEMTCEERLLAEDAVISCSPMHIKKTVMNLLINAVESLENGGEILVLTTNLQVQDSSAMQQKLNPGYYVVLTVQDNGSGIAAKDQEHIFEPFYTRKKMGRSGTGLGLSVVWNTVQDHKGKIFVESSDKGTCFQLYFPVIREKRTDQPRQSEEVVSSVNGETILVVDDEPQLRDIACQMLTRLGYNVDSVSSGELALRFLADNSVDLMVIDMQMEPGMNGRETYEKISRLFPGQRAIIASGYSESDEVRAALELGVAGFIKKPYSMDELGRSVREALAG